MRVSLFVTCLVDQFFPEVGKSVVQILEELGVEVEFPEAQTCCGQPAFNDGFRREARMLAERFLSLFEQSEYIVAPSGSCTSMVRNFYPELFAAEPHLKAKAQAIAARTFEFSQFLVRVLQVEDVGAVYRRAEPDPLHTGPVKVAYHDSCHLLRELGVYEEPRRLLQHVQGIELVPLEKADMCCGFGGLFSLKYSAISDAILQEKVEHILASGAEILVANDTGCLMQIGGKLHRQRCPVQVMHLAELLARRDGDRGERRP
ncbi:MAG: (Fe-S)-binding protein [Nitrospinota bacterium]|nr:MAG: (Fe-S)-binding protein [Nitrospinota bacterium]